VGFGQFQSNASIATTMRRSSYFPAQNPSLEVTRDRSEATQ
jgi:hypothetical protein